VGGKENTDSVVGARGVAGARVGGEQTTLKKKVYLGNTTMAGGGYQPLGSRIRKEMQTILSRHAKVEARKKMNNGNQQ
jgi:hypothetical protein